MSFSFEAAGTPGEAIRMVASAAATQTGMPQEFADAINNQLSRLPTDASVRVNGHGHTGWGEGQTRGTMSLHVEIQAVANAPKAAEPNVKPAA